MSIHRRIILANLWFRIHSEGERKSVLKNAWEYILLQDQLCYDGHLKTCLRFYKER